MLFKRNDQCLITTIPSSFYPVDGALGMKEIVDVVMEQDSLVQHSVLLDEGEMTTSEVDHLGSPILTECDPSTTFRRVAEVKVTAEQATTLEDGGLVFLPQESNRACSIMVSPVESMLTPSFLRRPLWFSCLERTAGTGPIRAQMLMLLSTMSSMGWSS